MSITNVYYKPHVYTPAYNPIVWSIESNKNSETDFSYVIDVYVNGATGANYRIKQRPNPVGVCMVDLAPVIQPYIELTNWTAEEGYPNRYRSFEDICAILDVRAGEEYIGSDGNLTIFNGSGATGAPAYQLYADEGSINVRATPAAFDFEDQQNHLSDTADFGYYGPYIMDGNGKFLKRDSNQITVQSNDVHTLSFLNWNDNAASSYAAAVQGINVQFYGATGALGSIFYPNIISEGGGPMSNANYTSITFNPDYVTNAVKVGPRDLDLPVGTTYYEVQAYYKDNATSATGPDAIASEKVTFTLDTNCNDLYPPVRLSWLNDLGGRDYYNFTMKYEKTTNSSEQEYYQSEMNWSGTTPVALDTATDTSQNWLRGGNKSYNKNVTTTFLIESDWIDQEKMDYLGAIPESPSVWAYIDGATNPVTAKVTNLSYTYKLIKQQKLAQATFNLTFTKVQQKQNY